MCEVEMPAWPFPGGWFIEFSQLQLNFIGEHLGKNYGNENIQDRRQFGASTSVQHTRTDVLSCIYRWVVKWGAPICTKPKDIPFGKLCLKSFAYSLAYPCRLLKSYRKGGKELRREGVTRHPMLLRNSRPLLLYSRPQKTLWAEGEHTAPDQAFNQSATHS